MPFGYKKYKKQIETCEMQLAEQKEIVKQRDIEQSETKRLYETYKNETDAKLIKNEEIIRKMGQRWDALENNFIKKVEELNQEKIAKDKLINELTVEINVKSNTIENLKQKMDNQNEKIQTQEHELESRNVEIKKLQREINSKEETMEHHVININRFQHQIENLDEEVVIFKAKIEEYRQEIENQKISNERLKSELETRKEKGKELENEVYLLDAKNRKLEDDKKEETENLKKIIETKKKDIQEKSKLIESYKNRTQQLGNIEQDFKEANNQIVSFKREIEEKNKLLKDYKNEIHGKDTHVKELLSLVESSNRDIIGKGELINRLEIENNTLRCNFKTKEMERAAEKSKTNENVLKLKEQIFNNEKRLIAQNDDITKLEVALKQLEEINREMEKKFKTEVEDSKEQFIKMVHSKNMIIASLEASEKRTTDTLSHKDEIIKNMENEIQIKEANILSKEKELAEIKRKLEDILRNNEVLEYKVQKTTECKTKEINSIEAQLRDQVKLVNEAFEKEWELEEHGKNEFIKELELAINNQIGDHKTSIKIIDEIQQATDQLVNTTNKKIELCTSKMKEHKNHMQALQKVVVDTDNEIRELREEVVKKEFNCEKLKKQMTDNLSLLQSEILKSEVYNSDLSNETSIPAESTVPNMENILRQVHTRNVVMKELREEIQTKQNSLLRIQEKYQKLSEKIKRVVITVTNAKIAYQELEKENRRLRQSLSQRKYIMLTDDTGKKLKATQTKTRTISQAFSTYNLQTARMIEPSEETFHIKYDPRPATNAIRNSSLPEEIESLRDKSRNKLVKVGLSPAIQKNIEHLKSEIHKERKLRKRQEALFTSVFNTLKSASACSEQDENSEDV